MTADLKAHADRLRELHHADRMLVLPNSATGETSQHNGTSMAFGDNYIGNVVSAIENGPDWSSTAIFTGRKRRPSRTCRWIVEDPGASTSSWLARWPSGPTARSRARSCWLARLIHWPTAVNRSFPAAVNAQMAIATRQASE